MNKAVWSRWSKKNITDNQYAVENEDWIGFNITLNGNPTKDFALSIDFAKKLAMLARTEAGERIRQYFVEVEKLAVQQTLEPEELMLRQVQMLIDQKKRLHAVESKVQMLEAKTATRPDYFTIAGYATLNGQRVNLQTASRLGGIAARMCRDNRYEMGYCEDPRFGRVRTYPRDVLDHVFKQPLI